MKQFILLIGFLLTAVFATGETGSKSNEIPFEDSQRHFYKSDFFLHSENDNNIKPKILKRLNKR